MVGMSSECLPTRPSDWVWVLVSLARGDWILVTPVTVSLSWRYCFNYVVKAWCHTHVLAEKCSIKPLANRLCNAGDKTHQKLKPVCYITDYNLHSYNNGMLVLIDCLLSVGSTLSYPPRASLLATPSLVTSSATHSCDYQTLSALWSTYWRDYSTQQLIKGRKDCNNLTITKPVASRRHSSWIFDHRRSPTVTVVSLTRCPQCHILLASLTSLYVTNVTTRLITHTRVVISQE